MISTDYTGQFGNNMGKRKILLFLLIFVLILVEIQSALMMARIFRPRIVVRLPNIHSKRSIIKIKLLHTCRLMKQLQHLPPKQQFRTAHSIRLTTVKLLDVALLRNKADSPGT